MLRAVRLTGSVFFGGNFTAPFGVVSPKKWDESTPLARLRHISIFHLVASGRCTFEHADGSRRDISTGDLLLLPFADEHRFWNGTPPEFAFAPDIVRPGPIEGVATLNYGGGGEETRLICGYIDSSEFLFTPVFRTLPPMMVEQTGNEKVGALMASAVKEVIALVDAATPGTQVMLGRMMELLFVEFLRRHASRLPADSKGLFSALKDPVVGRALARVHADPARNGRRKSSRAKPAHRAPCWPNVSMRCSGGRRSTMSPAGASSSPPTGCATATTASPASPPTSAMNPRPRSTAPSNARPD